MLSQLKEISNKINYLTIRLSGNDNSIFFKIIFELNSELLEAILKTNDHMMAMLRIIWWREELSKILKQEKDYHITNPLLKEISINCSKLEIELLIESCNNLSYLTEESYSIEESKNFINNGANIIKKATAKIFNNINLPISFYKLVFLNVISNYESALVKKNINLTAPIISEYNEKLSIFGIEKINVNSVEKLNSSCKFYIRAQNILKNIMLNKLNLPEAKSISFNWGLIHLKLAFAAIIS